MEVFHSADRAHWEEALTTGEYRWSTRDVRFEEAGSVHCSATPDQVRKVAEAIYRDYDAPLVVLEIDVDAARQEGIEVRMEDGGDGELYPHIYGPLRTDWVVDVHPAGLSDRGFEWRGEEDPEKGEAEGRRRVWRFDRPTRTSPNHPIRIRPRTRGRFSRSGWTGRGPLSGARRDLDEAGLATRSVPPVDLSVLGLIRHMTDMENVHLTWGLGGGERVEY